MIDDTLTVRLARLEAPDTVAARRRAIDAVPARIAERRHGRADRSWRPAWPQGQWPRLAFAAILAILVVGSFSVFTAPGRAFATWVGDRLGFGQPGEHPTLQTLRHHATLGTGAHGRPAYVLLRGEGTRGGHYEFVTFTMKKEPGKAFPANGARCFEVDLPEQRNLFLVGCGLPPATNGLTFEGVGGNSGLGHSFQFASGLVSADVATVEVEVDGRPVGVSLRSVPAALIDQLQIRRPFKFFISFFDGRSGKVKVIARDSSGAVVATRSVGMTSLGLG